jgi:D-3-phosphoglycerate dehydrogenase
MAKHRCAILDDYQSVALKMADWSKVAGDLEIKVFSEPLGGPDAVAQALKGFAIICAMRERTPFPRSCLSAPGTPTNHHRWSTGRSSRGRQGAQRGGLRRQLRHSTTGIAWGLILKLTRRISFECAAQRAERLAERGRHRRGRPHARRDQARQARHKGRRGRQGVPHAWVA